MSAREIENSLQSCYEPNSSVTPVALIYLTAQFSPSAGTIKGISRTRMQIPLLSF